MNMPTNPEYRNQQIAKALDRVKMAAKVRGWYHQFEQGHRHKTDDVDQMSTEMLQDAIRTAMGYGYPIEAIAGAASISIDEATAIANGPAAA